MHWGRLAYRIEKDFGTFLNSQNPIGNRWRRYFSYLAVALMLLTLYTVFYDDDLVKAQTGQPAEGKADTDWIVEFGDDDVISYTDITLDGNLSIKAGGKLTLEHVDMKLNQSGLFILIEKNGELIIQDSKIHSDDNNPFEFIARGKVSIIGSEIYNTKHYSAPDIKDYVGGIQIYSNNSIIRDSEIHNPADVEYEYNDLKGVGITAICCSPVIYNTNIHHVKVGIIYDNSSSASFTTNEFPRGLETKTITMTDQVSDDIKIELPPNVVVTNASFNVTGLKRWGGQTKVGEVEWGQFGYSVSNIGDVNNDGYEDVIVSAPRGGTNKQGEIKIYPGSETGLDFNNPICEIVGENYWDYYGFAVSGAGDINNDGRNEVLVSAPYFETTIGQSQYSYAGRVYIYSISEDYQNNYNLFKTIDGNQSSMQFGYSVAGIGDINNDGYDDFGITAPFYKNGSQINNGKADIWLGGPTANDVTKVISVVGDQYERLGRCVDGGCDIDSDGYDDFIIGSMYYKEGANYQGRVFVYYGDDDSDYEYQEIIGETDARLGSWVSSAGDVNGDDYDDIVIGDVNKDNGDIIYVGAAYVYYGTPDGLDLENPDINLGENIMDSFGTRLAGGKDINNDGFDDIVVTAIGSDVNDRSCGKVYAFYGSEEGITSDRTAVMAGKGYYDFFGSGLDLADVDNDGWANIVVGAYYANGNQRGSLNVYHMDLVGMPEVPAITFNETYDKRIFGIGDYNDDGFDDYLISKFEKGNGEVSVYFGNAEEIKDYQTTIYGDDSGSHFGYYSAYGDINDDGKSDFAVSAPNYNTGKVKIELSGNPWVDYTITGGVGDVRFGECLGIGRLNYDSYYNDYADLVVSSPGDQDDIGHVNVYYGSSPPDFSSADVLINGENVGDLFGMSFAIGDIDNNAYDDIVVGAPGFNGSNGRVYIYKGSSSGISTTADEILNGTNNESLGYNVAVVGDLNSDGYDDIAIGSPDYNQTMGYGRILVYYGGKSDVFGDVDFTIEGIMVNESIGGLISSGGDLNGDGYSDFLVGSPQHFVSNSTKPEGMVEIVYGSPDGIGDIEYIYGNYENETLGSWVEILGDCNNDYYSDGAITAPGNRSENISIHTNSYPFDPEVNIGADWNVEWSQEGRFNNTVTISGEDVIEAFNDNIPLNHLEEATIPIRFASTVAGKYRIDSLKIEYMEKYWNGPQEAEFVDCKFGLVVNNSNIPVDNTTFKKCYFGIYIDEETIIVKNCTFKQNHFGIFYQDSDDSNKVYDSEFVNNTIGIDCKDSEPIIHRCEFEYSYSFDIRLLRSNLSYVEMPMDVDMVDFQDNISKLLKKWLVSINGFKPAEINIYDINSSLEYCDITNLNGYKGGIYLTERYYIKPLSQVEMWFKTPHKIDFGNNNSYYAAITNYKNFEVLKDYDSDDDYYWDGNESDEHVQCYEVEDFVDLEKRAGSYALQNLGDEFVFNETFPFEKKNNVTIYILARCTDESITEPGMNIYLDGEKVSSHFCDPEPRWYRTGIVKLDSNNKYVRINAVDCIGNGTILIDRIIIVDLDRSSSNSGQYSIPYISDMDSDGLPDGTEITENKFIFEAEHYNTSYGQQFHDKTACNGMSVESLSDSNPMLVVPFDFNGSYTIYLSANVTQGQSLNIYIDGQDLGSQGKYSLGYSLYIWEYNGTGNDFDVFGSEGALVDKVMIIDKSDHARLKFVYDGTNVSKCDLDFSGNNNDSLNILIPLDSKIITAFFKTDEFDPENCDLNDMSDVNIQIDGDNFDIDENYIVYQDMDDKICLYNYYNKSKSIINFQGKNPRLSEDFVVYERSNYHGIELYQISSGNNYTIAYDAVSSLHSPDISGDYVIWLEAVSPDYYDLKIVNLRFDSDYNGIPNYMDETQGVDTIKTIRMPSVIPPRIYNNHIVFYENGLGTEPEINYAVYTPSAEIENGNSLTGGITPVINNVAKGEDITYPDIYGNHISYLDSTDLCLYTINTNTTLIIANSVSSVAPAIESNQILFYKQGAMLFYDISLNDSIELTSSDHFRLYQSNVVYTVSNGLKGFLRDFELRIGEDSVWTHSGLFVEQECSIDLSDYLSSYINENIGDADDGEVVVPMEFVKHLYGNLSIMEYNCTLDFQTDPFDSDTDLDLLPDGFEADQYHRTDVLEFEDAIEYKESVDLYGYLDLDGIPGQSDYNLKASPFFFQTGVVLTSINWSQSNTIVKDDSWVMVDFVPKVTSNHMFQVKPKFRNERFDTFKPTPIYEKSINEDTYLPYVPDDIELSFSKSTNDYLEKVIESSTYLNISEIGCEKNSEMMNLDVDLEFVETIQDPVSLESTDKLRLSASVNCQMEMSLRAGAVYAVTIGCNMGLIPDYLNPNLKDELGNLSEVPDNFDYNISMITLINLDNVLVYSNGIDPMTKDTDKDGVEDAYDAYYLPLGDDIDRDGLSDYLEIFIHHTNPIYRDTDYDGIRDPVELGYSPIGNLTEITSYGSWTERIIHNMNPFNFTFIKNWDLDHDLDFDGDFDNNDYNWTAAITTDPLNPDSDGDGLVDGWRDGWRYISEDDLLDYNYPNSYYGYNAYLPMDENGDIIENRRLVEYHSGFDERYWGYYGEVDNLVQVYEAEDKNCDGRIQPGDLSKEPILNLHFNEASGNIAYNETMTENNGDISGSDYWNEYGISGNCLNFSGDDYVDFEDSIIPKGEKTISFWLKDPGETGAYVFSNNQYFPTSGGIMCSAVAQYNFITEEFDVQVTIIIFNTASGYFSNLTVWSTGLDWHQYTFTSNGGNLKGYVDGVYYDQDPSIVGTESDPTIDLCIGKLDSPFPFPDSYYEGYLDEFSVYDIELTPEEIQKHFIYKKPTRFMKFNNSEWEFEIISNEFDRESNFESLNFEGSNDYDWDGIGDGYEALYATRGLIYHNQTDFSFSPNNDSDKNYDIDNYIEISDGLELSPSDQSFLIANDVAMKVNFSEESRRIISRVSVKMDLQENGNLPVLELWSDNDGPMNCFFSTPSNEYSNGNCSYNIPFTFSYEPCFTKLNCTFWIVLKPEGNDYIIFNSSNNISNFSDKALEYKNGNWNELNYSVSMSLFYINQTYGDNLTNFEEYVIGSNPRINDTDNDGLTDIQEIAGSMEVNASSNIKPIFQSTFENGAMGIFAYDENDLTDEYIYYDEDGDGQGKTYHFSYLYENIYENVAFFLLDKTKVFAPDGAALIIGPNKDDKFYVFSDGPSVSMPSISKRGNELYFSNPLVVDTDFDNVPDNSEINWSENFDFFEYGTDQHEKLGSDTVPNVRDQDSDNDGIMDNEETNSTKDEDGLGLDSDDFVNMLDYDSDGDGLWDCYESQVLDSDNDGWVNIVDPDSDNDGLPDGWADGFIWDPINQYYVNWSTFDYKWTDANQLFGSQESWEGEDFSNDGERNKVSSAYLETDPFDVDSDNDGLYDGFDYNSSGDWSNGELYNIEIPNRARTNGQTYYNDSTLKLGVDTDNDGLPDGFEVNGWSKPLFINRPSGQFDYYLVVSNPSEKDSDHDDIDDRIEFNMNSLPNMTDTDQDGLSDFIEINTSHTKPYDFDTDKDHIPDGYVENWWRDITNGWFVNLSDPDGDGDSTADPWEGEDRNCDGILNISANRDAGDSDETNYTDPDCDNDNITDGDEYFFDLIYRYLDPLTERDVDNDGTLNPWDTDSDGDTIPDNKENYINYTFLNAVVGISDDNPYYSSAVETNPYDADSDGDGRNDNIDDFNGNYYSYWNDADMDGLINAQDADIVDNFTFGSDTDGDGLNDTFENNTLLTTWNDGDTDNDGLTDGEEFFGIFGSIIFIPTNPFLSDTDFDLILDHEEITTGSDGYITSPSNPDTDDDGWSDKGELDNSCDPTDPDSDGDGLLDGSPFEGNLDSDEDGIINALEVDSDRDGIDDNLEDANGNGVYEWGETDPTDLDSDDDGLPDGWIDGWGYNEDSNSHPDSLPGWDFGNGVEDGKRDVTEGEDLNCDGTQTASYEGFPGNSGGLGGGDGNGDGEVLVDVWGEDLNKSKFEKGPEDNYLNYGDKRIYARFHDEGISIWNAYYFKLETTLNRYNDFYGELTFRTPTSWELDTSDGIFHSGFGFMNSEETDGWNDIVAWMVQDGYTSPGVRKDQGSGLVVKKEDVGDEDHVYNTSVFQLDDTTIHTVELWYDSSSEEFHCKLYESDEMIKEMSGQWANYPETSDFNIDSIGLFTFHNGGSGRYSNDWEIYRLKANTGTGEVVSEDPWEWNEWYEQLESEAAYLRSFNGDTDGDGLFDGEERVYGTDPYNWDTDGDELGDYTEVYGWNTYIFKTSPTKAELESNFLSFFKYMDSYLVTSNPLKQDSDGDGLLDGLEFDFFSDPNVADSDDDGLDDEEDADPTYHEMEQPHIEIISSKHIGPYTRFTYKIYDDETSIKEHYVLINNEVKYEYHHDVNNKEPIEYTLKYWIKPGDTSVDILAYDANDNANVLNLVTTFSPLDYFLEEIVINYLVDLDINIVSLELACYFAQISASITAVKDYLVGAIDMLAHLPSVIEQANQMFEFMEGLTLPQLEKIWTALGTHFGEQMDNPYEYGSYKYVRYAIAWTSGYLAGMGLCIFVTAYGGASIGAMLTTDLGAAAALHSGTAFGDFLLSLQNGLVGFAKVVSHFAKYQLLYMAVCAGSGIAANLLSGKAPDWLIGWFRALTNVGFVLVCMADVADYGLQNVADEFLKLNKVAKAFRNPKLKMVNVVDDFLQNPAYKRETKQFLSELVEVADSPLDAKTKTRLGALATDAEVDLNEIKFLKSIPTDCLDDLSIKKLKRLRNLIGEPTVGESCTKYMKLDDLIKAMDNGELEGFFVQTKYVDDIIDPVDARKSLNLPDGYTDENIVRIVWNLEEGSDVGIPGRQQYSHYDHTFTGTGFVPSKNGKIIPEVNIKTTFPDNYNIEIWNGESWVTYYA